MSEGEEAGKYCTVANEGRAVVLPALREASEQPELDAEPLLSSHGYWI